PFIPRRTGGRDQRFCCLSHRRACHSAVRAWAVAELQAGRLPLAQIRNGLPATRTLATAEKKAFPVPEAGESDERLLDDLLIAMLELPLEVWQAIWNGLPDELADRMMAYMEAA